MWAKLGADNIWEVRKLLKGDGDPFNSFAETKYFHGRALTQEKAIEILEREAKLYEDMNKALGL